jgi:hypothetical protein
MSALKGSSFEYSKDGVQRSSQIEARELVDEA